jgi:hypothetical protein
LSKEEIKNDLKRASEVRIYLIASLKMESIGVQEGD